MTTFESTFSPVMLYISLAMLFLLVIAWVAGQKRERKNRNANMKRKIISSTMLGAMAQSSEPIVKRLMHMIKGMLS